MEVPQKDQQRHPIQSENHHQQLCSSPLIVANSTSSSIGPNDSGDGTEMRRCANCLHHSSDGSEGRLSRHMFACTKCRQKFIKMRNSMPEELVCSEADCRVLLPNDDGKFNFGADKHEAKQLGIKKCCKYRHFVRFFDPKFARPFTNPHRKQRQQQQSRRLRNVIKKPLISARKRKNRQQKERKENDGTIAQIGARMAQEDSTRISSNSRETANSNALAAHAAGEGVSTFVPARLISVDGINVIVLNIEQLNKGGGQQQSSNGLFVHLVNGNQRQFLYTEFQCANARESKLRLAEDLPYLLGGFSEHIKNWLLTKIDELDPYLFEYDGARYERQCSCGTLTNDDEGTVADALYHALFDFLINIGWIDRIDRAEATFNRIATCDAGRGIDATSFNYLMNAYKLNAQPVQMAILREIAKQFAIGPAAAAPLKDPSQCEHCSCQFPRNSAHLMSNLLINFGLCSIGQLRAYSTLNCTHKGVPRRARDVTDFFIHTGRFIVYGPGNVEIPPNYYRPGTTTSHIHVIDASRLDENTLCFAFCHRRTEKFSTKGNAMYFGTRNRCYAGTTTFSDSKFDRWFFVPIDWHQSSYSTLLPYGLVPIQQQHPHHLHHPHQQYAISAGGSTGVEAVPISGDSDHHCSAANIFNPQQSISAAGHYANVNNACWPLDVVAAAAQTYDDDDDLHHHHHQPVHHQPVHLQQQQQQFERNNRLATAAPRYAVTNAIASAAAPPIYYYEQPQWPSSSSSWSSSSSSNEPTDRMDATIPRNIFHNLPTDVFSGWAE